MRVKLSDNNTKVNEATPMIASQLQRPFIVIELPMKTEDLYYLGAGDCSEIQNVQKHKNTKLIC